MSEDSEYEAYNDFASLTEADFAVLDAVSTQAFGTRSNDSSMPMEAEGSQRDIAGEQSIARDDVDRAMPSVSIELEGLHTGNAIPKSPIRRYRRNGTLSVTDLVSLSWCELQFDYGLQQKRFLKLADRPSSFRSASGKEITVQQDVAATNDKTTKRGRFIHKELELELKPEEIRIPITSEEERWALRLMNTLASLLSLAAENCAREIPVFGMIEGIVVVGIIDELRIIDLADAPNQPCEAEPFQALPTPTPQTIRLIDTKTRRTDSLPPDEDTEPTKLQVMLYHRLLTTLLEAESYDFSTLYANLGLDSTQPFSAEFMFQTMPILEGPNNAIPGCLQDLAVLFGRMVAQLNLPRIEPVLQVIYRSQNKYPKRVRKGKGREEEDLAAAIQMSLTESFNTELAQALLASALEAGIPADPNLGQLQTTPEIVRLLPSAQEMSPAHPETAGQEQLASSSNGVTEAPVPPTIISVKSNILGTKEFSMNDAFLDAHLHSAIQWWNGLRKARGVAERQTRRCFSCEYNDGCEWREQKAAEKLEEARKRREARDLGLVS